MAGRIRLGRINYLNCLPVYYGIEKGIVPLDVDLFHGPPTQLNGMFLEGGLDITPISSIEYARNADRAVILPDMSVSADGRVTSILLVSKQPIEELDQKDVAVTTSSATSVVLLKILMARHWQKQVTYKAMAPELDTMLATADAALLIGDDALRQTVNIADLYLYDLGEVWKEYTGMPMVYALWVINKDFSSTPEGMNVVARAFLQSKTWGMNNIDILIDEAVNTHQLPRELIAEHFRHIKHLFDQRYQQALLRYYQEAAALGFVNKVPTLKIWGEDCDC